MIFLLILGAIVAGLIIASLINFFTSFYHIQIGKKMMRDSNYREKINTNYADKKQRRLDKAAVSQKLYQEGKIFSVLKNEVFG